MAVTPRKSTRLETIIPLVKAQIVSAFGSFPNPAGGMPLPAAIDASRIFTALASDQEIMARAPADQFIAIKPQEFPIDEGCVAGGGNDVLWVDGSWEITYFLRYAVDQSFADDQYLIDGILPKWSKMITALQLFDPVDSSGVGYLAEPMRLAMGGWRNMPTSHGKVATWGRLKSYWEVKYVHLV
jgi:hypothetical protein